MEPTEQKPIELTAKAVEMAKKRVAEAQEPVVGLRLGVRGTGCSGVAYVIEYATKVRPSRDLTFDFDGLTIVVDQKSLEYLKGSTLDWEAKLMGRGFKWINPNVKSVCGCGESFSV